MILNQNNMNGPQFSKVIVVVSIIIAIIGFIAAIVLPIAEPVAIALIGICGTITTTTIVFNLKKSQAENTVKIYMSAYKEILDLKNQYNNEECDDIINEMEDNIKNKMNNTIDNHIEDATSLLEAQEVG